MIAPSTTVIEVWCRKKLKKIYMKEEEEDEEKKRKISGVLCFMFFFCCCHFYNGIKYFNGTSRKTICNTVCSFLSAAIYLFVFIERKHEL